MKTTFINRLLGLIAIGGVLGINLSALPAHAQPVADKTTESRIDFKSVLTSKGQSKTLLSDGSVLLLGGKSNSAEVANGAELWLPRGTQKPLSKTLNYARSGHTATLLPDGTVLILGGSSANGEIIKAAERFDPIAQSFGLLPNLELVARSYHSASVLADGRVLIVGGLDERDRALYEAEVLDPVSWKVERFNPKLDTARFAHIAEYIPSDAILIMGGTDRSGHAITQAEIYDARSLRFITITSKEARALQEELDSPLRAPQLTGSQPEPEASNIAVDTPLVLRFNKRMDVTSLDVEHVTLFGPTGSVPIRVVPVERGGILFITPIKQLLPATRYTLFVKEATDNFQKELPLVAIGFTTAALNTPTISGAVGTGANPANSANTGNTGVSIGNTADISALLTTNSANNPARTAQDQDLEDWIPNSSHINGLWWARRGKSPLQDLPPLQPGLGTALTGQVLTMHGRALANVTLTIDGQTTRTDNTGRFLLDGLASGQHTLVIDGKPASHSNAAYGLFQVLVSLESGKTNQLGYTIWMPKMDPAGYVNLPSPTTSDMTITSPRIPGLELRIPAGTVIRDLNGKVVTRINITAIPTDRPPFPLPDFGVPVYFSVQPGGAVLQNLSGKQQGAQLIYPNYRHELPGAKAVFWDYDPSFKGWYSYGLATISTDGKQAVPDAGVKIYQFTGAMFNGPDAPYPPGTRPPFCGGTSQPDSSAGAGSWSSANTNPGGGACPKGSDPVNFATGQFEYTERDLFVADVTPIDLQRTYRSRDLNIRAFGLGMTHNYAGTFLYSTNQWQEVEVYMPDGSNVHFIRTSSGNGYTDAVMEPVKPTGQWAGAVIRWNLDGAAGGGWKLTFRDGRVWRFGNVQPLQEVIDRNGNATQLVRSSGAQSGPITKIISPNGRYVQFTYDATNTVITQATDNIGRSFTYTYDASNRLTQVADPNGKTRIYTWDTVNNVITKVTDPNGNVMVQNTYQSYTLSCPSPAASITTRPKVTQQTLADGTTLSIAYTMPSACPYFAAYGTTADNALSTLTTVTDRRGNARKMEFQLDVNGLSKDGYIVKNTFPVGKPEQQISTYSYGTTSGQMSSMTDALGRTANYTYDATGNVTSTIKLAGTANAVTTSATYDIVFGLGKPLTTTDANNNTTTYGYDSKGNLLTIIDPLSHVTTVTYDPQGRPLTVKDANNNVTSYAYDSADLSSMTDPLGRQMQRFTDSVGRESSVKDPLGNRSFTQYDVMNRVTQITDVLGNTIKLTYDNNGNVLTQVDQKNNTTTYTYTGVGQVATMKDALLATETNVYEAGGKLSKKTDRKGQVSGMTYDGLGRLTFLGFGATAAAPTAFTSAMALTWDAGNRLTQILDKSCTSPATNLNCSVSVTTSTITRVYDGLDRLTQETTPQGQSNYTYDAGGRRTSMTVKNLAVGSTTTYTAQPTITYTYDTANRLTGITQAAGSLNNNVAQTITYTYDAGNRRTQTKLANGSTENYTYDLANQLTGIVYKKADGTTLIGDLSYTYDANGRRKSMGGSLARVAAPLATTNISTATYDANNRLTKWGGTTATTQSTLSYDNNGNLITDGTYTYTWNARNQLQTVSNTTGGTVLANYSYDASGRRTSKAILSGTTTTTTGYAYDGANFVQELNRSGTPTSPNTTNDIRATLITAGVDEALARMTGSGAAAQVLSLATDGNNNTLHTSDQAQTQNTAYTYEAYGRATSTNSTDTNSQQYTGRELDIKSAGAAPTNNNPLNSGGLMYYRARYYLPGCARFISEDPIGWASGQTNGYGYVGGSPVHRRDPFGLAASCSTDANNNIIITIPITFSGPGATPDVVNRMTQAIQSEWSQPGFTVNVTSGTDNRIFVPTNSNGAPSFVNGVGGNSGTWYGDDPAWVAAHEAGHLMGLPDRYSEVPGSNPRQTNPDPGWLGTMMGSGGAGSVRDDERRSAGNTSGCGR
jgi:RHS repeat-associated protein